MSPPHHFGRQSTRRSSPSPSTLAEQRRREAADSESPQPAPAKAEPAVAKAAVAAAPTVANKAEQAAVHESAREVAALEPQREGPRQSRYEEEMAFVNGIVMLDTQFVHGAKTALPRTHTPD